MAKGSSEKVMNHFTKFLSIAVVISEVHALWRMLNGVRWLDWRPGDKIINELLGGLHHELYPVFARLKEHIVMLLEAPRGGLGQHSYASCDNHAIALEKVMYLLPPYSYWREWLLAQANQVRVPTIVYISSAITEWDESPRKSHPQQEFFMCAAVFHPQQFFMCASVFHQWSFPLGPLS